MVTIEIFLLNFFRASKSMTKWQFLFIFSKKSRKGPMSAKDTFSLWGFRDSI